MKFKALFFASFAIALSGCGGSDEQKLTLYKKTGTLQCAATKTTKAALETEVSALRSAGTEVLASSCANDGVARAVQCGLETGDLYAVVVPIYGETNALKMGFQSAASFTNASEKSCQ